MNGRRFPSCVLFSFLLLIWAPLAKADGWQPIDPADLTMKDNPAQPGAKAMILYRSVERNDTLGSETDYVRIKIFNDEGKSYADVTVPAFDREISKIGGVAGRTIHPDGSIVNFNGQVYEKVVAKGRNINVRTKSFTLPDVTPGSIIEYRYTTYWEAMDPNSNVYYTFTETEWPIQRELYQRAAHFSFTPAREDLFQYSVVANRLPPDAKTNQDKIKHIVTLDITNVPAFEEEPYMPPKEEARMRVIFFYFTDQTTVPRGDEYWKQQGKRWYDATESFMNKKGAMSKTVQSITAGSDTQEQKLHKIYDYVQGLENLTFEEQKSDKELKRSKQHEIKNVEDVVDNKYGYRSQLNRTFVALARAAGFDATLVKLTERDDDILHKEWPAFSQLGFEVAVVKMNGTTKYLDPGSPFCPYGTLPWEDTGVQALLLDKNMPTWVQTPIADVASGMVKRSAKLNLDEDGSLSGEVEVTFSGEDAYRYRLDARQQDDTARKKTMEDLMQDWLPVKADITLESVNDWKSASVPLVAKYKLNVRGYASSTGRRVLIPATLFSGAYRNPFVAAKRVNPVYLDYLWGRSDDVNITLPKMFQVESLPKTTDAKNALVELSMGYANENGTLHFTRSFTLKGLFLEQQYYGAVRQYFQMVQSEANEQAVLKMAN
jgi:hypothetical protein